MMAMTTNNSTKVNPGSLAKARRFDRRRTGLLFGERTSAG